MVRTMTVTDLILYIEDNLENRINTDTICEFTGYSRRYIQIIFKKHINMPLWKYIRYRRITRAALLLRLTQSRIIDISFRLQFDSQQSFNREFKKIVGCTPLQYRKNKNWDLKPIVMPPKLLELKHPEPPDICFLDAGEICGMEISYEQERTETIKPFPMRWKVIDKCLQKNNSSICLVSQFYIGKKSYESIKVKTVIGNNDGLIFSNSKKITYEAGMYVKMLCNGIKERYIECINQLYLVTMPYYHLKRKEGYDIEIISKSGCGYKCELFVPIVSQ
ncbi:helix-turn-helix domain-containing protein [Salmonella enterica]|nr:helix-turn-helix domain-containing protein [Salmonella enterica]EDX0904653.1 helix-turn-helix domain-containing protein [Salmonella enterica subsp. enterica]EFS2847550.1 helix-turn-helix domain-containing protein [Salmonella enterica]EJY0498341.1 helix-turn-helix domain-containing protein [Salmonella enterica]EKM5284652.1 helix-turn-helix domain-containing protein [Salmonella enterica]